MCEKVPLFRSSHHDSTQVSGGSELRGGAANRLALAEATAHAVGPEFVALLVLLCTIGVVCGLSIEWGHQIVGR